MLPEATAAFSVPFSLDLELTLGPYRRGPHDPTIRLAGANAWRAARTPHGPSSIHLHLDGNRLVADAWGAGARWTLDRVPRWLGFADQPQQFRPVNSLLHELHRRHAGLRLGATGLVFEALLPTVLEQKVPGVEAWNAYARLCRSLGDPAPGDIGLFLQPSPGRLMETPYWAVHRLGIERRRFTVIKHAASYATQLERTAMVSPEQGRRVLTSLPGVGPWSAAEVSIVAYGDPDAVSTGDYHLPHQVAWALAGEPRANDARMLELLEPYRGHRARVIRLLTLGGIQAPRFGPRMRLRRIGRI